MKEYLAVLAQCPLLKRIDPEDLPRLLSCLGVQTVCFQKGNIIFHQDEPARLFGVVLSGSVRVIRGDVDGSHAIIAAFEPGELFGEALACASADALPFNVIAASDAVVLLFDHVRVMSSCSSGCLSHSRLVTSLLRIVAQKNIQLNQKLEIVMQRTTRDKLMAFLRSQADCAGSRGFSIPLDRQGLADYLGVERSAMSTELNKLKKEGLIDFQKNQFKLNVL